MRAPCLQPLEAVGEGGPLENKLLATSSTLLCSSRACPPTPCPSLQPSSVSCTSSTLLSSSFSTLLSSSTSSTLLSSTVLSTTSTLLSTENRLLSCSSALFPTSMDPADPAVSPSPPPLPPAPGRGRRSAEGEGGGDAVKESCRAPGPAPSAPPLPHQEEQEEEELSLPELQLSVAEEELQPADRQDDFSEVERGERHLEELKDAKYLLLNAVCCSLVNKSVVPGQDLWDQEGSVWTQLTRLAQDIGPTDPQFLLKVAVYTRQELNIRTTANFLVALAAHQTPTKPHVRRYYCAAVQLPSDWLEVARLYSTCFSPTLPTCLKKAMADKFKQFSEHQLAKYNTRRQRCKHSSKTRAQKKKATSEQLLKWANMLGTEQSSLEKILGSGRTRVDKKESQFNLKKMIGRLHIKEPAQHVMALLGKRYPGNAQAFTHSGLPGTWDHERAGQRMKLQAPETWERLVSQQGNNASSWSQLIDQQALPFMAMLRNLRSLITQGISEEHHRKVLSRLTNQRAVVQSRQFPFRFLSAYKAVMELRRRAVRSNKAPLTCKQILRGIMSKIPPSKRCRLLHWDTADRKRLRVALGVPYIYHLYRKKKDQLQTLRPSQRKYNQELLDRYCRALETSVQLSSRYNVPPLPGRTLILLSTDMYANTTLEKQFDFCCPLLSEDRDDNREEEEKLTPSLQEVAILFALMIGYSAEEVQLIVYDWKSYQEVKLKSDMLLENVPVVLKQIKELEESTEDEDECVFFKFFANTPKVDTIVHIRTRSRGGESKVTWATNRYVKEATHQVLLATIGQHKDEEEEQNRNVVHLSGFSEQILKFLAARGSSRLLDHVEHMDKLHNIRPPEGAREHQRSSAVMSIPASPVSRWRSILVFVSSTFRDMHAERDLLVRCVFPELRRRAAPHCLRLQEVELRWGVTEEEAGRATQLCLAQVCRCQLLVAMLGQRYGNVPPRPALPTLPQYHWLASAPPDLSITEMEIQQFQSLFPDAPQRMFCYFRDPRLLESVPVAWRSHFAPESKEAEVKMAALKTRIRNSNVKVTENYPCAWGGLVEGQPYLRGLEEFGQAVLEDLWTAISCQFVQEADDALVVTDVSEQEGHQGSLQRQFYGRAKLLAAAVQQVREAQAKGGMLLVEGAPGAGKTVFMAALADALRVAGCDVISYSTATSQSARSVQSVLRCLVQWLRKRRGSEDAALPSSYRDLLKACHTLLSDTQKAHPLAVLVDGAELIQDFGEQPTSDWIPQQLTPGLCVVLSITSNSSLLDTLSKKRRAVVFPLGPLTMADRKEIVQKGLEVFGKKLSDAAFNNQLQVLLMKKGSVSPLYLHLACEDLRTFSTFEQVPSRLNALPQAVDLLLKQGLSRLLLEHRGEEGLRPALQVLCVSAYSLGERDLYLLLNTCTHLTSLQQPITMQELLRLARTARRHVPMATFTSILQSLQSLIGPSHCHSADQPLALTNPDVRRGFEQLLLPCEEEETRAHLLLAAHLWTLADPQGKDTFLHCDASSIRHLPASLMRSGQQEALSTLLSNYYFLYANVRHGLLHHLLEIYSSSADQQGAVQACGDFLWRQASLLASWPGLFLQQALNQPPNSSAHAWAQGLVGGGRGTVVQQLNSSTQLPSSQLLSSFPSRPTCIAGSPDGVLVAVGTARGSLHLLQAHSGQEVKSLLSSCDGVSGCVFLGAGLLATTSYDGRIEMWDVQNSCRTVLIEGHSSTITGSDVTTDRKHLATVSLDYKLKVWSLPKGHQVAMLKSSSPLNCVTFDPEGHLLASGCWSGEVVVWSWLQDKTLATLSGHQGAVRSLSFPPSSSSMLCSGSVGGEVRLWSVPTSTCVGRYQAHCGATDVLHFLEHGALLSAGEDHMLHLWSGGLGCSMGVLQEQEEPPKKKMRSLPAALCVALKGDLVAVGYHGDGLKLFSLDSAERTWSSEDLQASISCLLWLEGPGELLVSGGGDKALRLWRSQGNPGRLLLLGRFGMQGGAILALAQNSSVLASASNDCSITLWAQADLTSDTWASPTVVSVLRGHSGGVTCLAFSPEGGALLSGGKDQALVVWDVSCSPPVLTKTLRQAHSAWVSSCVWSPQCVASCCVDGRLCVWDLQTGQKLRQFCWKSPLTCLSCEGPYVLAGGLEGSLHVWKWETSTEICHLSCHAQKVTHCCVVADQNTETVPEEMTVATTSEDGTVKLWKPFQVEHFRTFPGHSGGVQALLSRPDVPQFLSVSVDGSLRCWSWSKESGATLPGPVTALCYWGPEAVLLAGYQSGRLEVWQNHQAVGHTQASSSSVSALCSMPGGQLAVACGASVTIWRLVWSDQRSTASLEQLSSHKLSDPVRHLHHCSTLLAAMSSGLVTAVLEDDRTLWDWFHSQVQVLQMVSNDGKSLWLLGEKGGDVQLGFMFAVGSTAFSSMCSLALEKTSGGSYITAATVDRDLLVCGDIRGNMWFTQPDHLTSWTPALPAHADRISVLRVTSRTVISGSYDHTVKLWSRDTKKQVGLFVCDGPVLVLEVNPQQPNQLVCGDFLGKLYFLSWQEEP